MKTNRRNFLRLTGLAGAGVAGAGLTGFTNRTDENPPFRQSHNQRFNMSGYAAPKLETVRVGFIGIGGRGSGALRRMVRIEGVQITALADLDPAEGREGQGFREGMGS
jgi:hypothetical protein